MGEGRMFAQERHITSVRMSRDKADEVLFIAENSRLNLTVCR